MTYNATYLVDLVYGEPGGAKGLGDDAIAEWLEVSESAIDEGDAPPCVSNVLNRVDAEWRVSIAAVIARRGHNARVGLACDVYIDTGSLCVMAGWFAENDMPGPAQALEAAICIGSGNN